MKRLIILSGRLVLTIVSCVVTLLGSAQNITRQYDNVSLSKALMELNDLQQTCTINFIYDELEDFRVTTSIKHKSVTEAIMQIIGFYPVRVVKRGESEIYVECTHKTERHLTGTIIDENCQPVPYANVYLLHPSDSTVIGGGVSNEAGVFVIPIQTMQQRAGGNHSDEARNDDHQRCGGERQSPHHQERHRPFAISCVC